MNIKKTPRGPSDESSNKESENFSLEEEKQKEKDLKHTQLPVAPKPTQNEINDLFIFKSRSIEKSLLESSDSERNMKARIVYW